MGIMTAREPSWYLAAGDADLLTEPGEPGDYCEGVTSRLHSYIHVTYWFDGKYLNYRQCLRCGDVPEHH